MCRTRFARFAAALPLLFTLVYASCPDGRDGFVLSLKFWHVKIAANTCS